MADKTFTEKIDKRLAAIEQVVESLAENGTNSQVRDLRILLVDVIGLLKRDPGLEAAADDLYAAAAALAKDIPVGSQPLARKLRLLREAKQRFHDRLLAAAVRTGPDEYRELGEVAAHYAAHLVPSAVPVDLAYYRKTCA